MESVRTIYEILAVVMALLVFASVVAVVVLYIADISQTTHAIRRNFPVVGRFRYFFEHMGEFFRQYFFAQDREEMPFNRAERSWVYRAAKNIDTTVAFGSTRDLKPPGTPLFVNCAYPTLETDAVEPQALIIGPGCRHPYETDSLINISGMSFGAISKPAVQALSRGAKAAGIWMNTGEGGLSPYHLEGGCDIVFQIGTAKYGVQDDGGRLSDEKLRGMAEHPQVRMFELKLSQGAKPGKGGILPGEKVTAEIAAIRHIEPGQPSISPNRHPEIESAGDLMDMIERIREVTGKPTGFKAVISDPAWLDEIFQEIERRGQQSAPDFITVDSADGGTGAAPQSLIDFMGLPVRESLPMLVDKLDEYGLRGRVRVIASGKLIIPSAAALALCAGADFVTSARGFMFALGCIQALQCNKNTCPTGITTHDKRMQKGLDVTDKAVRVQHFAETMRKEIGVIAHSCGVPEPRQLRRNHCRVVTGAGTSVPLDQLFPYHTNERGIS